MDAEQALSELMELSSQITSAVVLDAGDAVVASSPPDPERAARLSAAVIELVGAAGDLGSAGREVTRVEVELDEGAIFVVREAGTTVAAVTGPSPTSGLVVYDLRTCAQAIDAPAPRKRRTRKPKENAE
jgi:predicted regulator of Ras-like GTPase activity (Roadblock/LC7/MglB family)